MYTRQYMTGKLYWRYKKNGKWTWTRAQVVRHGYSNLPDYVVEVLRMEEE